MAQNGILIGRNGIYYHMWWVVIMVATIMGCSDSSTGTTEDPPTANQPPVLVVDVEPRLFGMQGEFTVKVTDDNALASAWLLVDDTRYELEVTGLKSNEQTITHDFQNTGNVSWSAGVEDSAGLSASSSGSVYVVPTYAFQVQSRGFWTKEPGYVEELTLRNLELRQDQVLLPDENGVFSAELYEGLYVISDVKGAFYNVSRMLVDRDLVDDSNQYKDDNEFTYLVSGKEATPWLIELTGDMASGRYYIETLDRNENQYTQEDLLENLSRLTTEILITPRYWETQTIVYNLGNPDFPDDFDFRTDFYNIYGSSATGEELPGKGRYPYGTKFSEEAIKNFQEYLDETLKIFNNDVIGINPYTIDVVEDTAENLSDFFTTGPPYLFRLKDNVQYIGGNGGTGIEVYERSKDDKYNAIFTDFTIMFVPGISTGIHNANNTWYSNEELHWGTIREAWNSIMYEAGPICSVKDKTSASRFFPDGPEYCRSIFTSHDGGPFKHNDVTVRELLIGFNPWAGRQLNSGYFSKSDEQIWNSRWNTANADRGFNVRIQD